MGGHSSRSQHSLHPAHHSVLHTFAQCTAKLESWGGTDGEGSLVPGKLLCPLKLSASLGLCEDSSFLTISQI